MTSLNNNRVCSKCGTQKTLSAFSPHKLDKLGTQSICKECRALSAKANNITIKQKEYRANYRRVHINDIRTQAIKRRVAEIRAIPGWVETDNIAKLYRECRALTELTGIKHEVDHLVPLISDMVSGLHCLANMVIITKSQNASKSNRFWPDM